MIDGEELPDETGLGVVLDEEERVLALVCRVVGVVEEEGVVVRGISAERQDLNPFGVIRVAATPCYVAKLQIHSRCHLYDLSFE